LLFAEREGTEEAVLDAKKFLNAQPPEDSTTLQQGAG